jgi:hypothetical protein
MLEVVVGVLVVAAYVVPVGLAGLALKPASEAVERVGRAAAL